MTLAIMQPYLFPYIGYFQLIHVADKFVFYDDVNFIKQGWINRNRILQSGEPAYFTLPVKNISSFNKICDVQIDDRTYELWRKKFFKTLAYNYGKSPGYTNVIDLIQHWLPAKEVNVAEAAKRSIYSVLHYLDIKTEIIFSSSIYNNNHLASQERVMDICKKEQANVYINVSGGQELYSYDDFSKENIQLRFIKTNNFTYNQNNSSFHPFLSIIDLLMFCKKEEIRGFLEEYIIIENKN